jgi:hypothetical protein
MDARRQERMARVAAREARAARREARESNRRARETRSEGSSGEPRPSLRLVIAAAPKAGNQWLRCLLSSIYGLQHLEVRDRVPLSDLDAVRAWTAGGGFRDGTIFHEHCRYSPALCDLIEAVPARPVTIVRDPYDMFVSLYFWMQARTAEGFVTPQETRIWGTIVGKPLEHRDVLAYLAGQFSWMLTVADGWLHGGRAVVVRYEELTRDPIGHLTDVTGQVVPVAPERLERALADCSLERMRRRSPEMATYVRKGVVGDSHNHLSKAHLAIFRDKHADLIRRLGYEVR